MRNLTVTFGMFCSSCDLIPPICLVLPIRCPDCLEYCVRQVGKMVEADGGYD